MYQNCSFLRAFFCHELANCINFRYKPASKLISEIREIREIRGNFFSKFDLLIFHQKWI